ncbi:MAG: DUF6020 family protein [Lachnospiraceae bacterium]|nr:DUF6020 family protein [Lachnospiraceae bacterium]
MKTIDRKALIISVIYGALFGMGMSFGHEAYVSHGLEFKSPSMWIILFLSAVVSCIAVYAYMLYSSKRVRTSHKETFHKPHPIITFAVIYACWMPVFLAEFPGFFVYDASDEYVQVATRGFTTHHPLMHTLALGGSVRAGEVFCGSANTGIAIYILLQMAIVAFVFTYILHSMERLYVFGILWYGLFPVVVMFALCSVKDTLFAAALAAAVVLTPKAIRNGRPGEILSLAGALLIMMFMRHNGVYAYIIYACVMFIYTALKRDKTSSGTAGVKKTHALLGSAIFFLMLPVIYMTVNAGLAHMVNASDTEHQEVLTVPIQQIARTWNKYGEDFTPQDEEDLYSVLSENALTHYTPELSDPVKSMFDNEAYAADKADFWKLWLKMLKLHPVSYLNAWLDTSYGYYYPLAVVNPYAGHEVYTFTYTESSYFGYEVEYPGERHSLIPVIDRFYRWLSLDDDIQRVPVISLFFSMGAMFWFYLFGAALMLYRRRYDVLAGFVLPFGVLLTLLLGPTFLPRYTVFWWFLFPYLINEVFYEKSND